ncbi:MAG TPA: septum formation initiator family protein [Bacteroidota bacterium]|nr:septum formation initiator family protein [Bacteroidota bacterium]
MDSLYLRKYRPALKFSPQKILGNKTLIVLLLVGIPALSFITFSPRGLLKRMSLESEKADLVAQVAWAEAEQARLQKESRDLDRDLGMIEKIAREHYGMILPGETVYKVKKDQ